MSLLRWAVAVAALCGAGVQAGEPLSWPASARDAAGGFFRGRASIVGDSLLFAPEPSSAPSAPSWSWRDYASLRWPHVRGADAAPEAESLILSAWGDVLPGQVVQFDEREAVVRWSWGGETRTPRAALAGLAAPPGRRLQHHATYERADEPRRHTLAAPLLAGEAAFLIAAPAADSAPAKNVDKTALNLDAAADVTLHFGDVTVRVQREHTNAGRVWMLQGAERAARERPRASANEARLHLRWNGGRLTATVDDQHLATAEIGAGRATAFAVGESIREARVYRAGEMLRVVQRRDADRDVLQLDDDETLYGTIVGLNNGRWQMRTSLGDVSIEAARTSAVLLRRQRAALPLPAPAFDVPLRLPSEWSDFALDGRRPRVGGSLEKVTERGVELRHPVFGPLLVPLAWTAGVDVASRNGLLIVSGGPHHLSARASHNGSPIPLDGRRLALPFAATAPVEPGAVLQIEWLGADVPADPAGLTIMFDGQPLAPVPLPRGGFEWLCYSLPAGVATGEHVLHVALPETAGEDVFASLGALRIVAPPGQSPQR